MLLVKTESNEVKYISLVFMAAINLWFILVIVRGLTREYFMMLMNIIREKFPQFGKLGIFTKLSKSANIVNSERVA